MGRLSAWVVGLAGAPGICWAFAGIAFWVSTTSIAGPLDLTPPTAAEAFIKHLLYGAAAFFALLPVAVGDGDDRVSRVFGSRAMTWLGTVSYGIFLWNMAMLTLTFALLDLPTFKGYFWQVLAVELALTVSIAAVSWYVVERPAMKLRRLVR
jgi:peptidoglycan/LPS O-acetylase OafA/YrhL